MENVEGFLKASARAIEVADVVLSVVLRLTVQPTAHFLKAARTALMEL